MANVVCDNVTPDGNGYTVLHQVRADASTILEGPPGKLGVVHRIAQFGGVVAFGLSVTVLDGGTAWVYNATPPSGEIWVMIGQVRDAAGNGPQSAYLGSPMGPAGTVVSFYGMRLNNGTITFVVDNSGNGNPVIADWAIVAIRLG